MEIIIKDTNASKSIIDQNSVRWKLYSKKFVIAFIYLYGLGLVMFIFGMTEFNEYGWKHFNGETSYYTNWHLSESIGFVLIIFATFLLIVHFKNKNKFFKKTKEASDRQLKATNEIIIRIHDDHVSYKSYELVQEIKWWLFSSYKIKDNYLLLNFDEDHYSAITIDKRLISPEEFNQVLELVKKRVVPKI